MPVRTIPPTPPRLAQESYGLAHSATYLLTLKTAQDARDFWFSFPVVLPPTACTFRPRNAFKNSAGRSRFLGGGVSAVPPTTALAIRPRTTAQDPRELFWGAFLITFSFQNAQKYGGCTEILLAAGSWSDSAAELNINRSMRCMRAANSIACRRVQNIFYCMSPCTKIWRRAIVRMGQL